MSIQEIDGWREPTDVKAINWRTRQAAALVRYEVRDGLPVYPGSPVPTRETKILARYGENIGADAPTVAARLDPITRIETLALATKMTSNKKVLAEIVNAPHLAVIKRGAEQQWALCGGRVSGTDGLFNTQEQVRAAVEFARRREVGEEMGKQLQRALQQSKAHQIYTGFPNQDARNTRYSWLIMDTALFAIPQSVQLQAGDDAADAKWFPFGSPQMLQDAMGAAGEELFPPHIPIFPMVHDKYGELASSGQLTL